MIELPFAYIEMNTKRQNLCTDPRSKLRSLISRECLSRSCICKVIQTIMDIILKNSLKSMEEGNIDRFIKFIDDAIERCDKREETSDKVEKNILPEDVK